MSRIAVFSLTYPPFVGGAEVAVAEITKRLPQHQFTVFTARLKPELLARETVGAVTVIRVGKGSLRDKYVYPWKASRAAAVEHQQAPFQIVWGIMASWGGWAALKFKDAHPDVPYVLTEQSGDSDTFIAARTWFWEPRYRQMYTKADAVTVLSKFLADRAKRYGAKGVTIIPNGVDVAMFSRPAEGSDWQEIRTREQLTKGTSIITVSRLVQKNGLEDLIAAIEILRKKGVPVNLLVAGSGPLEAKLCSLADALGLRDAVQFMGHVDQAQLPALLQFASVFVRPSLSEGFGVAFVEAMAAGLPVVATPVGGIPDFLQDGVTGLVCQPNNPHSVASAIERLLKDENLRQRISSNARQMVGERYDWNIIVRKMEEVFQSVQKV